VHYEVRLDGKALDPAKFLDAGRYVFRRVEVALPVAASAPASVQRDGESSRAVERGATGGAEDTE
jgi:hypothetical protein